MEIQTLAIIGNVAAVVGFAALFGILAIFIRSDREAGKDK